MGGDGAGKSWFSKTLPLGCTEGLIPWAMTERGGQSRHHVGQMLEERFGKQRIKREKA